MSLKKKMGAALFTTAMGAALIGGGTFALFTSEATNDGNTVATGTLEIEDITGGEGVGSAAFTVTDMAPGDGGTGTVTIKNKGSLDAWVAIDKVNETGDLAPALNVTPNETAVKIPAGGQANFTVDYDLPSSTGNDYQDTSATIDVVFKAVQAKNNTNSTETGPKSWNEDASE